MSINEAQNELWYIGKNIKLEAKKKKKQQHLRDSLICAHLGDFKNKMFKWASFHPLKRKPWT